jgi:peroxin-6
MLKAITRSAKIVDEKVAAYNQTHTPQISIAYFFDHLATEEDTAVMVTEEDFMEAHKELVPSVSADELRHYDRVRKQFEGAGKKEGPADDGKKKEVNGDEMTLVQQAGSSAKAKGKGKARAPIDEVEDMVVRTENIGANGHGHQLDGGGVDITGGGSSASGTGSGSGKGKGKAVPNHHAAGKSSVDIAEGGFGDATQDDDLYS